MGSQQSLSQDTSDFPEFLCNYLKKKHEGIEISVETLMASHKEVLFRFFTVLLDKSFQKCEAEGKKEVTLTDIYRTLSSICHSEATTNIDTLGDQVVSSYYTEKLKEENEKVGESEEAETQTFHSQTPSLIEDIRRARSTQEHFESSQQENLPEESSFWDSDFDFDL